MLSHRIVNSILVTSLASLAPLQIAAQSKTASGYDLPPENILRVLKAPLPPIPSVSPTKDKMLLATVQIYPTIERVATPYLRLAGVRVEPKNHSKHDTPGGYGITDCATGIDLVTIPSGEQMHLDLGGAACPQDAAWSADGRHFAFANLAANSVELLIAMRKREPCAICPAYS